MKARRVAGFRSARAAAATLGVKPATYAAHENGSRTFSIADARRYAELYDVSPGWILTGEYFDEDPSSRVRDESIVTPINANTSLDPRTVLNANESLSTRDIFNFGKQALELLKQLEPATETDLSKQTVSIGEVTIKAMLQEHVSPEDEDWEFVAQWRFPPSYLSDVLKLSPLDTAILAVVDDNMSPTYKIGDRLIVNFEQKEFTIDGVYFFQTEDGKVHIQRIKKVKSQLKLSNDNPVQSVRHPVKTVEEKAIEIQGKVCGVIAVC